MRKSIRGDKVRAALDESPMATRILGSTEQDLRAAQIILKKGGTLAFPTETVYGLGADATSDSAVRKIFAAKGRPEKNPLIIHVNSLEMAEQVALLESEALKLAKSFWPGPLTMVLKKKREANISESVTAGLESVAVRMPAHPVALELIRRLGHPIAAPSANLSGRISGTSANIIADQLSGRIDAIVDGGSCILGIESTIVDLRSAPRLLRHGAISLETLEEFIGAVDVPRAFDQIEAPGQLRSHYAPKAKVKLNQVAREKGFVWIGFGACHGFDLNLSLKGDLKEAAANLYAMMTIADHLAAGGLAIAFSPIPDYGLGRTINDRLRRAATSSTDQKQMGQSG